MKKITIRILTGLLLAMCLTTALLPQEAAAWNVRPQLSSPTVLARQLSTPSIASVSNVNGGVQVSWKKISGAAGYRVFRKTGNGSWTRLGDTTTLTFTDKTAKSGTKYTYTVRCISQNGKSYTSSYNGTGKTITYIAAPVLKNVSNGANGVGITWEQSAGAAGYRVFRKTGNGSWTRLGDTTDLTFTDKTAKSGTKYTYTVRCISQNGKSYTSSYNGTGKTITYIAAPVLKNVSNGANGVGITWEQSAGAAGYRVFRKTGNGSWTRLGDTTTLTFTDKTAKSGTKYTYTVRCISQNGKSYTSSYNGTGKTITYIAAPALKSAVNSNNGITVTWNESAGAARYRVFRKTAGSGWQRVGDTTALSLTDTAPERGKTYIYTVRCLSANGKAYTSGYDASGKTVTRYLNTPVVRSAVNEGGGIRISWDQVSGAAQYRVFRKTANSGWERVGVTQDLTILDTTPEVGTAYLYTVRCISSDGKVYTSSYDAAGLSVTYRGARLSESSLSLMKTQTFVLTVQDAVGTPIWSSSNTDVAEVENGTVTAVGAGKATITAAVDGRQLTCVVTVASALSLTKTDISLLYPATEQLAVYDKLENANTTRPVIWTSNNTTVATVRDGKVTPVGVGSAAITAVCDDETFTCKVTVTSNPTLSVSSKALRSGDTVTLTVSNHIGAVSWSSSNSSVASVSNGTITAGNAGTATVTASVDGKQLTCTVTVSVDKTALNAVISTADGYVNAYAMKSYYKPDSWAAMTTALAEAKAVSGNATAGRSQVDQAADKLQTAIDGLTQYSFEDGELVFYREESKKMLEDINDFREENGLQRLEWSDECADYCRVQSSYNCMAYVLDYGAYQQYVAGTWSPAYHNGDLIGTARLNGTIAASKWREQALQQFIASPNHKANLLDNSRFIKYAGVALCSYECRGKIVYVCIVFYGTRPAIVDYRCATALGVPLSKFCTIEDVLSCTER